MNNLNISDWLYASFTAIVNRKLMIFPWLVYYFVTCLEQALLGQLFTIIQLNLHITP